MFGSHGLYMPFWSMQKYSAFCVRFTGIISACFTRPLISEPLKRRQVREVLLRERVTLLAEVDLEHGFPRVLVRERNVDTLLETTANSRVQLPRLRVNATRIAYHVRRAEHQNARLVLAHAVHLHQELVQHLTLTAAAVAALAMTREECAYVTRAAQRIDLIDEDHRRLLLARHHEQLLHQTTLITEYPSLPCALSLPLAHQIRRRDRHERTVRLRRHGLRQIRFTFRSTLSRTTNRYREVRTSECPSRADACLQRTRGAPREE